MAELLQKVSIISFLIAIVFILVAIILFFALKIPRIIGDLTGRNAKKSIEKMRMNNEKTGNKSYRPSNANLERGKLTNTMPESRQPVVRNVSQNTMNSKSTMSVKNANNFDPQTTSLMTENISSVYDQQATGLLDESGETELLVGSSNAPQRKPSSIVIEMIDSVMFIDTEEEIC
jgi:Sec-independent protein translocase protein TatA